MQKLLIKPEDLKGIINKYYAEDLGIAGTEVVIKNELGSIGYGLGESTGCIVNITLKLKRSVLGNERVVEQRLTEAEVREIIAAGLNKDNFVLADLSFDSGVKEEWSGYGPMESKQDKPYFNGIMISFREQEEKRQILG